MIAIPADPNDPEDRDVSVAALERALEERRVRLERLRGPQKSATKQQVSIRLDGDLLGYYRATGPGWQGRVNAALRKAAGL